ncbi:MAG: bifunctional phosphoribosylaminoimidazolecarboxamide formyltransferase/IMP cyclohydrolase [Bacteroidales bacterium]|nr:bifunctional phosphoribosylaminoimidazolecarboxamide formyltransferase/IMP cyclohydrolase [Bacteroidales bacterium]
MEKKKKIRSALLSVYHKDGLDPVLKQLVQNQVRLISTGGTAEYIRSKGYEVTTVESLTGYPGMLGGRVKTLHPKIFGGILGRREVEADREDFTRFEIPEIDLVVVDLYPFEQTVGEGGSHDEIIEKIDIGGITLIRAAAKNYRDVLVVSSMNQYPALLELLENGEGATSLLQREQFAKQAFAVSSAYDTAIYRYFTPELDEGFRNSTGPAHILRYGENPHQKGLFFGDFNALFDQLHGKEISYNNLLDVDAAVRLADEFTEPMVAVLKHNNACGLALRSSVLEAWKDALAGDPVSAFGGIIITNRRLDEATALEINKIFYEVVIAPEYDPLALEVLMQKKKRIILQRKTSRLPDEQFRSLLNGVLWQERDSRTEVPGDLKVVTKKAPDEQQVKDLLFANILVKHTKSNAIVLAKNGQLLASGAGQTSRIDALQQAIDKATRFGFDLHGAVMASDAFFPFADSVTIAHQAGVEAVIQPGGSIRDQESIDYCNEHNLIMVFSGIRHFKH